MRVELLMCLELCYIVYFVVGSAKRDVYGVIIEN